MLDALRRSASGWVAKIFLGLLVVSFAIWGIADIFGGYNSQAVAEVGSTEVSLQTYENAYRREMSLMADRLGRQLTPDEARTLGVDRRVLSQLLASAALNEQAREIKLSISDTYIAGEIVANPTFRDAFGRFSRDRYERILQYSGLNEAEFVADQKRVAVQQQLNETVAGDVSVPSVLLDAVRDFQGAKRVVEYFVLPAIAPDTLPEPDDETLTTFYSANEAAFTTPELRALTLLVAEPEQVAKGLEIDDKDIETEYAARRAQYETEERRAVDQILFSDAQAAAEARKKISEGADFLEIAAEAGFSASDIELGLVTQSEIVDPKIAEVAFKIPQGETSDPVEGALGTAIIRVRQIEPAHTRPIEEVRGEIRDALALERARDEVLTLFDSIEDERAGGATLPEIAATFDLALVEIPATDRRGRDGAGAAVAGLPASADLLRVAFESEVGIENDAVETQGAGFIWFDVGSVTAPELKPFDTVREAVETQWRANEAAKRQRDLADDLVQRARSGAKIADLATEAGATAQTSEAFTRRSPTTPFSPGMVEAIFAAQRDGVVRGAARDSNQQAVAKVTQFLPADTLAEKDSVTLKQDLTTSLGGEIYEQYVSGIQARAGVVVNQATLNSLFGERS